MALIQVCISFLHFPLLWGVRWRGGGASDSESRGPRFVFEQDTLTSFSTLIPRKSWFRPDMTENLLTGTL